ncbi:MAG: hypothetical protein HKN17_05780 [Rhodothermales bacterium]|nr:hypothetical protein [Rhodothermales bacterium]
MKSTDTLVQLNIEFLRQGRTLLGQLDDQAYTACDPPVYNSGIGEHMRHILEHYELFVDGLSTGFIDYDARRRDAAVSSSCDSAMECIDSIIASLSVVDDADRPVEVKLAASKYRDRDDPKSDSTVKRELQYLQAHTIHHFALIAMILRMRELDVPDDFGVAPSTLQFRMSERA